MLKHCLLLHNDKIIDPLEKKPNSIDPTINKEKTLQKIEQAITEHPIKAAIAPIKKSGLPPIFPIKSETGIRVIAIVINWSDNGSFA